MCYMAKQSAFLSILGHKVRYTGAEHCENYENYEYQIKSLIISTGSSFSPCQKKNPNISQALISTKQEIIYLTFIKSEVFYNIFICTVNENV